MHAQPVTLADGSVGVGQSRPQCMLYRMDTRVAAAVPLDLCKMRFTWLDPGGQCHCCLAKMSV